MELQIVLKLTMFYAWSGVVYKELLIMIIITLKCSDCIFWFRDSRCWKTNVLLYISGLCNCYEGYTGIDCRINMNEPPILATDLSNDSLCDTGARACNFISAFGENIYASNNTKCRVQTAQVKRFYRYKIN